MKMTVMPIVIDVLGTISKALELEIGGRVENIQTTLLLKSLRVLRNVLET